MTHHLATAALRLSCYQATLAYLAAILATGMAMAMVVEGDLLQAASLASPLALVVGLLGLGSTAEPELKEKTRRDQV